MVELYNYKEMKVSNGVNNLILEYKKKKHKIKQRLKEFRNLGRAKDKEIFSELCFCILTPQSKAVVCDEAISELRKSGLLFKGGKRAIRKKLKGVRFPSNKATFVVTARRFFQNGKDIDIKSRLDVKDVSKTRDWLARNVKGVGYKEASHFLRNIGFGKDIAILDVHILRNLKKYGIIDKIPASVNKTTYLSIEDRMRKFSRSVRIPLEELDLLFWSNQTGFIFK